MSSESETDIDDDIFELGSNYKLAGKCILRTILKTRKEQYDDKRSQSFCKMERCGRNEK